MSLCLCAQSSLAANKTCTPPNNPLQQGKYFPKIIVIYNNSSRSKISSHISVYFVVPIFHIQHSKYPYPAARPSENIAANKLWRGGPCRTPLTHASAPASPPTNPALAQHHHNNSINNFSHPIRKFAARLPFDSAKRALSSDTQFTNIISLVKLRYRGYCCVAPVGRLSQAGGPQRSQRSAFAPRHL